MRFGDWSLLRPLCDTGRVAGKRPFYIGDDVHNRMALVRKAIQDIRVNWDQYRTFMEDLQVLMQPGLDAERDVNLHYRADELFSSVKDWARQTHAGRPDDYSAVQLYTSVSGYRQMFSTINTAFRDDRLVDTASALRSAVFLVELLNIDLFNYCATNPAANNYHGRVYRGMVVSAEELAQFACVATGPIAQRYVAIPLAMASASADRTNALVFVEKEARRSIGGQPLLWDIEVAGLSAERLKVYRAAFQTSVVSSICAVPIERISDFPEENEVLLRGPFFQILRLRRDSESIAGKPLHVVEALMLTANRDHPSTMRLGDSEARIARDLFRILVAIDRSTRCAARAEQYGSPSDAAAFRRFVSAQQPLLERCLRLVEQRRATI
jgi:hypothetical protein